MFNDLPLPPVTLVLGGIRSGKSAYAERMIVDGYEHGLYLATAEQRDAEMKDRVRIHRERRGATWTTIEEPLDIIGVLKEHADPHRPVLVDSLTMWLANLLEKERRFETEIPAFVAALGALDGPVVLVADEVGLGGVSPNAQARAFADAAGQLNQAVAMVADRVVLISAGLPLVLKEVAAL